MKTFKEFLQEDIFKILKELKKKMSLLLGEDITDTEVLSHMDYLAIFEQFIRHLDTTKTDLGDVIGFNSFVSSDKITKEELLKFIKEYFRRYEQNDSINFDKISKSRANQFNEWFKTKSKDGLKIINDSTDYVLGKLENYRLNTRRLSA